jgi:protein gp37
VGANSKIEWTDHTFNPWRGCTKVSPGCANCYADTQSKRNPKLLGVWGPNGTRVVAADAKWREPLAWDKAAAEAGRRHRVFCASLADVFEDWRGPLHDVKGERLFSYVDVNASAIDGSVGATLDTARAKLFQLIRRTPSLDWLVLTKRPENVLHHLRAAAHWVDGEGEDCRWLDAWHHGDAPANVRLGTSVEDRKHGLPRVDVLRKIPAQIRFLSVEPLLEDLGEIDLTGIHWVIVGGESGPGARPMHPDWVRSIRDQCLAQGVAFFFKQWGCWRPDGQGHPFLKDAINSRDAHPAAAVLPDGRVLPDISEIGANGDGAAVVRRMDKKDAGRMLDGMLWSEFPQPVS